eukprot:SAG31_NODE_180_length_21118_cov_62.152671_9_plen_705_part_00
MSGEPMRLPKTRDSRSKLGPLPLSLLVPAVVTALILGTLVLETYEVTHLHSIVDAAAPNRREKLGTPGGSAALPAELLFAALDKDGDSSVSKTEMALALGGTVDGWSAAPVEHTTLQAGWTPAGLLFMMLDKDGDGSLSKAEVATLSSLSSSPIPLPLPGNTSSPPLPTPTPSVPSPSPVSSTPSAPTLPPVTPSMHSSILPLTQPAPASTPVSTAARSPKPLALLPGVMASLHWPCCKCAAVSAANVWARRGRMTGCEVCGMCASIIILHKHAYRCHLILPLTDTGRWVATGGSATDFVDSQGVVAKSATALQSLAIDNAQTGWLWLDAAFQSADAACLGGWNASTALSCLGRRRILFGGDSFVRNLFFALLKLLDGSLNDTNYAYPKSAWLEGHMDRNHGASASKDSTCKGTASAGRFAGQACSAAYATVLREESKGKADRWCAWADGCAGQASCEGTATMGRFAGKPCSAGYATVLREETQLKADAWCAAIAGCRQTHHRGSEYTPKLFNGKLGKNAGRAAATPRDLLQATKAGGGWLRYYGGCGSTGGCGCGCAAATYLTLLQRQVEMEKPDVVLLGIPGIHDYINQNGGQVMLATKLGQWVAKMKTISPTTRVIYLSISVQDASKKPRAYAKQDRQWSATFIRAVAETLKAMGVEVLDTSSFTDASVHGNVMSMDGTHAWGFVDVMKARVVLAAVCGEE